MSSVNEAVGGVEAPPRMDRRQRLALILLLTANFTVAVDFSVLNVALPRIGSALGFTLAALQWIPTAFALCAAGFTLLFGRVADLFGRRRLFMTGMVLLAAGSLLGGLAWSPTTLLVARVAQGLATAMVGPAALALMTTTFEEGPLRSRALGLNGSLAAAGFTTGAILGGLLTAFLSWRWAFLINVPVAVLVLVFAPVLLTEARPATRPKLDIPGAVLVTLGLLAVIYGLTTAGAKTIGDPVAIGSLVAGLLLLVAFWFAERKVSAPLAPVAFLRLRSVAWGNVTGLLAFVTQTSLIFLLTLYLQTVLGYTPLEAGLSFVVLGAGAFLGGLLAPKVLGRLGTRWLIVGGFVLQLAGTVPLVWLGTSAISIVLLLVATFVSGAANLFPVVGFMVTATSGLAADEQGLATGLTQMTQQVGITLGIPILSAIVAGRVQSLGGGQDPDTVLSGIRLAIAVDSALCLLSAVLLFLFLRPAEAKS